MFSIGGRMVSGIFWWNMEPDPEDELAVDWRGPRPAWAVLGDEEAVGFSAPMSRIDASAALSCLLGAVPDGEWGPRDA